jgi:stage III sporulation protein AA
MFMQEKNKKNSIFKTAITYLPQRLQKALEALPETQTCDVMEIRLKAGQPIALIKSTTAKFVTENGCLTGQAATQQMLCATKAELLEVFQKLCGHSVYSFQSDIVQGFVCAKGGIRAGVCGTTVMQGDIIVNIKNISSITLRLPKEVLGCADELLDLVTTAKNGVLVCGEPCSGKTTIIRDLCRRISQNYENRVAVIDTRGEIAAVFNGVEQNDMGLCDIYNGYPRAAGINQALRSLAPTVIVCDEIGSHGDAEALVQSANSGVKMVATMHAANYAELKKKLYAKKIMQTGAFDKICFLKGKTQPGKIGEIVAIDEE